MKKLNEIYESSTTKEDSWSGIVALFQGNRRALHLVVSEYLIARIEEHIDRRGDGELEDVVMLGELVPELFARCFTCAIFRIENEKEEKLKWLMQHHPQQFQDYLIEVEKNENYIKSPAFEEFKEKEYKKFLEMFKRKDEKK